MAKKSRLDWGLSEWAIFLWLCALGLLVIAALAVQVWKAAVAE